MKHTNHIRGVNDLVQEINNIIQNKQECQTMEYNIQLICCSCKIEILKLKGNASGENTEKNMTAWNLFPRKGF